MPHRSGHFVSAAILWFCLLGCIAGIFVYNKEVSQGVVSGLAVCCTTLIPALFPFLVLTSFLSNCPATPLMNRICRPLARLYRVPDHLSGTIFLSLIGGYPSGAVLTATAVKSGQISPKAAGRMMCGCVAAGPAFLVLGVGAGMCHSKMLGWYLLTGHLLSSLLCGILWRPSKKDLTDNNLLSLPNYRSCAEAFTSSVTDSCGKLLSICGFTVLCSAAISLLQAVHTIDFLAQGLSSVLPLSSASISSLLTGCIEVTSGCIAAASVPDGYLILRLAFITSLCSFSILAQIAAIVLPCHISLRSFLSARVIHALSSCFICGVLYALWPPAIETATTNQVVLWETSPLVSLLLLVMAGYVFAAQKVLKNEKHLL